MSLVGNFAFGNYDRTAETSGAQEGGTAFLPRSNITDQDPVQEGHHQERRGSFARRMSSSNRRPSNASATARPTATREETYATAQTHLTRNNTQQNALYSSAGATPMIEKTFDEVDASKAGLENSEALERSESESEAEREKEHQIKTD